MNWYKKINLIVLVSAVFLITGCGDDNDTTPLEGSWSFIGINAVVYSDGKPYNAKELDGVSDSFENMSKNLYGGGYIFSENKVTPFYIGERSESSTFSISGNRITWDGISLKYTVSGNILNLIFDLKAMRMLGLHEPSFDQFDDVEFVLSFERI